MLRASLGGRATQVLTTAQLARWCSDPGQVFLGFGFEWRPVHAQRLYELAKVDYRELAVSPHLLRLLGLKPHPQPAAEIGLPYLHGVEPREGPLYRPLQNFEGGTLLVALALATSSRYDLVLIDMQMPVMDGLESTRRIRQELGPELPIIAMTANAFGEDQVACLAAGMNDHLGKPVDPERLSTMLLRWLPASEGAAELDTMAAIDARSVSPHAVLQRPLEEQLAEVPGFSLAQGLSHVGGKVPVLVRVLRTFLGSYRTGVPGLLQAVERDDRAAVMTACHSLRGACASIGVVAVADLAASLEQTASSMEAKALSESAEKMHMELIAVVKKLAVQLGA